MSDAYKYDREATERHLAALTGTNHAVGRRYIDEGRILRRNRDSTLRMKSECLRLLDHETNGRPFTELIEGDLMAVRRALAQRTLAADTVNGYLRGLYQFLRWLHEGEPPRFVPKLLRGKLQSQTPSTPIFEPEHITAMIETCHSLRDKAIIAMLAATGFRASELLSLDVGSLTFTTNGTCRIELPADAPRLKTGPRHVFATDHLSPVRAWRVAHPWADDLNAPFFPYIAGRTRGRRMRYNALVQFLFRVKRETGIKTRVRPHAFRHTLATELSGAGMEWAALATHMGWDLNSRMAKTYVHLNDRLRERQALAAARAREVRPLATAEPRDALLQALAELLAERTRPGNPDLKLRSA